MDSHWYLRNFLSPDSVIATSRSSILGQTASFPIPDALYAPGDIAMFSIRLTVHYTIDSQMKQNLLIEGCIQTMRSTHEPRKLTTLKQPHYFGCVKVGSQYTDGTSHYHQTLLLVCDMRSTSRLLNIGHT
jgi:hypothetical protein